MKRMIAAFALMVLAIAVAIYIAMAPVASPAADGSLNGLLASLDTLVDHIEASVGRSTGALIAIGIGLALSLALALAPSRRRADTYGTGLFVPTDDLEHEEFAAPGESLLAEPEPEIPAIAPGAHDEEPAEAPVFELRSEEPVPAPDPLAEPLPAPAPATNRGTAAPATAAPEPVSAPPLSLAPLELVRKVREPGRDWFGDSSWLGGLPRLGGREWPRDTSGIALPFLAQIDLADLAALVPDSGLPQTGALAFFLGDGGVIPVTSSSPDFSEPPQDLPPAFEEGAGTLFPPRSSRLTRWLFPYWPVSLSAGQESPLPRDHPFYAVGVGEPVETLWWHSVHHFADRLRDALEQADAPIAAHRERLREMREALVRIENDPDADPYERDDARDDIEGFEADLARLEEQRHSLPEMIAAMDSFLDGREPWTQLTAEEREILRDLLPETHERYGELLGEAIPASLAELATISLRTAISGPPEAVATIPADTLARMNTEYRLPPEGAHRIFTNSEDSDELVLIDLAWDDMLEWCWPEEGRFQLRIAPEDAARGNWHTARALFVPS